MKNFNRKNSIAERGGLMIEALAMLGLIAVVTPTMYKKSAERTMEVEDINTATTMRTIMGAAEAYMSSNYTDIMRVMEENEDGQVEVGEEGNKQTIGVLDVPLEDLSPYLPYKYSADNALYNYKEPTVRIVRSGDNLTAFALFPAKVEEGVGQERTVRIASLVGSNGGYVSKDSGNENSISAHGVGGVWSLGNDYYSKVFKDDEDALKANNYSIVTSSANVVNSATGNGGGGDHPEFLLRYKKEGETWRNAMRTDLYMGEGPQYDQDGSMVKTELSSIRNINSLIVGTEDSDETKLDDGDDNTAKKLSKDTYGLYIYSSGADKVTKDNERVDGNAYIYGTILAAKNKLWASDTDLHYTGTNLTFDGTNFKLGQGKKHYLVEGIVEDDGEEPVENEDGTTSTKPVDGANRLKIMGNLIEVSDVGGLGNYKKNGKGTANVAINTGSIDQTSGKVNGIEPPKYNTDNTDDPQPDFGVDVADNMVVEGVLAAGQLDVNKIRTSNISVGSTNINDKYKWMDVDDKGVHIHDIHDPGELDNKKVKRQLEVDDEGIVLRSSETAQVAYKEKNNVVTADHGYTAAEVEMFLDSDGFIVKTEGKLVALDNSKLGIQISKYESGSTNTPSINIGNANEKTHEITQSGGSGENYNLNVNPGANVNVHTGNLRVDNGTNPVLLVRGKESADNMLVNESDEVTVGDNKVAKAYDIAARGNTVFADLDDNKARYLSMSVNPDQNAAVNITRGTGNITSDNSKGLLYIDMDPLYDKAYFKEIDGETSSNENPVTGTTSSQTNTGTGYAIKTTNSGGSEISKTVNPGSIYIRKGLIDIVPDKGQVGNGYECKKRNADGSCEIMDYSAYISQQFNADEGRGVIRASRFVANNVDNTGKRVMVPDFYGSGHASKDGKDNNYNYASQNAYADFGDSVFEAYNGADRNRYDTYMVNPAYTSVMNDIKLVSRGGARLSDILPTFITKGIYTAVNNSEEQQFRSNGTRGGVEIKCTRDDDGNCVEWPLYLTNTCPGTASPCLNIQKEVSDNDRGYDEPASPFIGIIPTPQCPPGYIRVIQITPASIRMAEAGSLKAVNSGYSPSMGRPEQRFGGLSLDVNDFTNPSNSLDDTEQVSGLGDHFLAKNIYDVYVGSDAGTASDGVRITNPSKFDVIATESFDFQMKSNPTSEKVSDGYIYCVAFENNDPNGKCTKWAQFRPDEKYKNSAEGGELMAINLANISDGIRDPVAGWQTEDNYKTLGNDFTGNATNGFVRKPNQFNSNYRGYKTDIAAEKTSGVWQSELAANNRQGNIVDFDVNIKIPGIRYATSTDKGVSEMDGWYMDNRNLQGSNLKTVDLKVTDQMDLSGAKLVVDSIKNVHMTEHGGSENIYVLTSRHKGLKPLTFQKSTWMKVDAVQLPWGHDIGIQDGTGMQAVRKDHPYITGWAVLMGFIYPETGYGNILKELGVDGDPNNGTKMDNGKRGTAYDGVYHIETGGLREGSVVNSKEVDLQKFYWNVFPVAKSSLEAYITTYCYFEETDYGQNYNHAEGEFPMVDRVNTFTSGYAVEEGVNKAYREKLNDPSMKYNELW